MHGGGDELHRHLICTLLREGVFRLGNNGLPRLGFRLINIGLLRLGFRLRNNRLLRLGFGLRFGGPVLGVHVMALESVGPHSMANLIGAHIFNKRRKYNPLPLFPTLHT